MAVATITLTKIGSIGEGIDGTDEYVLIKNTEDDLTPEQAIAWLLPKVYRRCSGAGTYFCHDVRAVQVQYSTSEVICTVEHRYDV